MISDVISETLDFINAIRKKHPQEIEDVFSNGFCYWFAKILELRFDGDIYFNPEEVHFATMINNRLFDINGAIFDNDGWINWKEYQLSHDTEVIYRSCILKL